MNVDVFSISPYIGVFFSLSRYFKQYVSNMHIHHIDWHIPTVANMSAI